MLYFGTITIYCAVVEVVTSPQLKESRICPSWRKKLLQNTESSIERRLSVLTARAHQSTCRGRRWREARQKYKTAFLHNRVLGVCEMWGWIDGIPSLTFEGFIALLFAFLVRSQQLHCCLKRYQIVMCVHVCMCVPVFSGSKLFTRNTKPSLVDICWYI